MIHITSFRCSTRRAQRCHEPRARTGPGIRRSGPLVRTGQVDQSGSERHQAVLPAGLRPVILLPGGEFEAGQR